MIDLAGIDLMTVMDEIKALIPSVLPVIIAFIGLRKGLSFVKSSLRGA